MEQNEKDGHIEMLVQAGTAALFALARIQADTGIDMEAAAVSVAEGFDAAQKRIQEN